MIEILEQPPSESSTPKAEEPKSLTDEQQFEANGSTGKRVETDEDEPEVDVVQKVL